MQKSLGRVRGSYIYTGTATTSAEISSTLKSSGKNALQGDIYICTTDWNVWEFDGNDWKTNGNIKGDTGPRGPQGKTGNAYTIYIVFDIEDSEYDIDIGAAVLKINSVYPISDVSELHSFINVWLESNNAENAGIVGQLNEAIGLQMPTRWFPLFEYVPSTVDPFMHSGTNLTGIYAIGIILNDDGSMRLVYAPVSNNNVESTIKSIELDSAIRGVFSVNNSL